MMRRLVTLVVTLLSLACGNAPTSPSSPPQSPSFPPQAPAGPPLTMRGEVWDTTNLPISGAQVQVVAPTQGLSPRRTETVNSFCRGRSRGR